jgi:hypothetical protein
MSSMLFPPVNFSFLEERLSRCSFPLTKQNALFCVSLKIERVLNFSGKPFSSQVSTIFHTNGIQIQNVSVDREEVVPSDIEKFQDWVAVCIEDIISQYSHASTLIVGR